MYALVRVDEKVELSVNGVALKDLGTFEAWVRKQCASVGRLPWHAEVAAWCD
jgi:hypothetical protein